MLESGEVASVKELAKQEKIDDSYVARVLRLTLLAPDIVEAILNGCQPDGMSYRELAKPFPVEWDGQREKWGFCVSLY